MRAVLTLDVIKEDSAYSEITFEVDFDIRGRHYAATLTDPEEYPELEVNEISVTAFNSLPLTDYKAGIALAEYYQKVTEEWFGLTVTEFDDLVEASCWEFADTIKQCNEAEAEDYYDNFKEGWD